MTDTYPRHVAHDYRARESTRDGAPIVIVDAPAPAPSFEMSADDVDALAEILRNAARRARNLARIRRHVGG